MNLLNNFSFELPTKIVFGEGVAGRTAEIVKGLGASRILLVTDEGVRAAGLLEGIITQLQENGLHFEIFDKVEPNPKDHNVEEGATQARQLEADCILAVGGGSPIDCAKAIAIVTALGGGVKDYAGVNKIPEEILPLVAIPTTAGSASEVTFSAVITDSKESFKFSIRSTRIAPRVALADPAMTATMPPALTASTGMDALTHAIEAYTVTVSEPISDACALHAVQLIYTNLAGAVSDGENMEARSGMLAGSILAGIAFSHSDVGSVHCLAEALGGLYDAPHGLCNAIVLPAVMEYNLDCCKERYARIAAAMGLQFTDTQDGARKAVEAVRELSAQVRLPGFNTLGIKPEDFQELAGKSAANGSNSSNPRPMAKDDYLRLLENMSIESRYIK